MRVFVLLLAAAGAFAATPGQEVKSVLDTQAAAWNRGDLEAFVSYYSAETVFVGKAVSRGNKQVLQRYKDAYPTQEKMGTLEFSDIELRPLGAEYASVLGRFHLKRTEAGGGNADGIFTLLFRKTPEGWKIILDHTS